MLNNKYLKKYYSFLVFFYLLLNNYLKYLNFSTLCNKLYITITHTLKDIH